MRHIVLIGIAMIGYCGSLSAQEIGVKECDEFLTHYQTCIESGATPALRGQMEDAVKNIRAGYLDLKTKVSSDQLKDICTAARAGMKQTLVEALKCTP